MQPHPVPQDLANRKRKGSTLPLVLLLRLQTTSCYFTCLKGSGIHRSSATTGKHHPGHTYDPFSIPALFPMLSGDQGALLDLGRLLDSLRQKGGMGSPGLTELSPSQATKMGTFL